MALADLKYPDLADLIEAFHERERSNDDNVALVVGGRGSGKSNHGAQVCKLVDPSFPGQEMERVAFGNDEFLAVAPPPPGLETYRLRKAKLGNGSRAVQGDELDLHKREAITRRRRKLLRWLKDCRGLNLTQLLLWPEESQADSDILSYCHWKCRMEKEGDRFIAKWYEASERKERTKEGERVYRTWVLVGLYEVFENDGDLVRRYEAKKNDHMRRMNEGFRDTDAAPAVAVGASGVGDGGLVPDADDIAWALDMKRKYVEKRGPGSSINEVP